MKHTLTFTDYIENNEESGFSVELVVRLNGAHTLSAYTRPIKHTEMSSGMKLSVFRNCLALLLIRIKLKLVDQGYDVFMDTNGTMLDMLSLFNIKQTPSFNNELHTNGIVETNILMASIW